MKYVIVEAPKGEGVGYEPFGAALEFWSCRDHEILLTGPYETGKTLACLNKLHVLLAKYPKARALMVRRTYKSLISSAVATYEEKVLPFPPGHTKCPVRPFGASMPQWYDYPNGSRLILGGMDRPEKFLSGEFDFIYVNQAEELRAADWETLTGRATGRAGNAPYSQVMGDCNPDVPWHWIRTRPQIRLFESRHLDNPTLYDRDGNLTEQGHRTMAVLNGLTGVRFKRGKQGLWVAAEGQVYDYDPAVHQIPLAEALKRTKYTVAGVDWGFTNPGVMAVYGVDGDKRMYLLHEVYRAGQLLEWWVATAKRLRDTYNVTWFACDPEDAANIAALKAAKVRAGPADNRLEYGIQKVKERLKVAEDGRPRLYITPDAVEEVDVGLKEGRKPTSTEQEFAAYVYPVGKDGRALPETPIDDNNHGMSALRYAVMYVEEGGTRSAGLGVLAQGKVKGWQRS